MEMNVQILTMRPASLADLHIWFGTPIFLFLKLPDLYTRSLIKMKYEKKKCVVLCVLWQKLRQ